MTTTSSNRRSSIYCLTVLTWILTASATAHAIVWADATAEPPTAQAGPMKHVGRTLFSRFEVFGGTCIWLGGKWVLTCRHGISDWPKQSLKVDFPAHGPKRYAITAVHFPPDAKVDMSLLELSQPLTFSQPPLLDARTLQPGSKIFLGGYGSYGSAKQLAGADRFHWGANVLESADRATTHFVMSPLESALPGEALPAMRDSGSPIFWVDGKQQLLVGISTGVTHALNPGIGDRAVATCVAGQAGWIKQIAPELHWHK